MRPRPYPQAAGLTFHTEEYFTKAQAEPQMQPAAEGGKEEGKEDKEAGEQK